MLLVEPRFKVLADLLFLLDLLALLACSCSGEEDLGDATADDERAADDLEGGHGRAEHEQAQKRRQDGLR